LTTGCVLSSQTVASISGIGIASAEPIQMTFINSATPPLGCMYPGTEHGSTVLVGISLEPTQPGWTPQQYLAENRMAQTSVLMPSQQNVPGLGDIAQVGTTTVQGETLDVVSVIQTLGQTVADLSISASGPSMTQQSAIALARAVLAAISN
jgi:hypothetical protein